MNNDQIAVSIRMALKMFWEAGVQSEDGLRNALNRILNLRQPTNGYVYADEVSELIGV